MNEPKILSICDIASWWGEEIITDGVKNEPRCIAALPSLQRGAVWKPSQIEPLWDSIIRGFPIGSFLMSKFDDSLGVQSFKNQFGLTEMVKDKYLLDGQQRATSIALAFLNPWKNSKLESALWVDLARPPEGSDCLFLFRVITRSHPWGYSRSNSANRIPMHLMRTAIANYRLASSKLDQEAFPHPSTFPLDLVWPIDAAAPIPVPLLVDVVLNCKGDRITALAEKIKSLPFWNIENEQNEAGWRNQVWGALTSESHELRPRLNFLINRFTELLKDDNSYGIPALVLPKNDENATLLAPKNMIDPIETLFVRVNRNGTRLDGEELMYSILKSAWKDAPGFINHLSHKITSPPRLVLLATRLVMAIHQDKNDSISPPATPNVARFRRLIHGNDEKSIRDELIKYLTDKERGAKVFETAKILLEEGKWGLPPALSVGIARSTPDVFLLLLRWIDRMYRDAKQNPLKLGDDEKKKLLGVITSFAWFSADSTKSVSAVWKKLQSEEPNKLKSFFSSETFKLALELGDFATIRVHPLVPPQILRDFFDNQIINSELFDKHDGSYWQNWNWWKILQEEMHPKIREWYSTNKVSWDEEQSDKYLESWRDLLAYRGKITGSWNLLLYAQREWLKKWFEFYDPSLPDQLEDINCPWDYDHIHPNNYVSGKHRIPQLIRDWHPTIGNFRAWPLEANRADHDTTPRRKFADKGTESNYVKCCEDEKAASAIGDTWPYWENSTPEAGLFDQYLSSDYIENHMYRKSLIQAILSRTVHLYQVWYENLKIGELMPKA